MRVKRGGVLTVALAFVFAAPDLAKTENDGPTSSSNSLCQRDGSEMTRRETQVGDGSTGIVNRETES